MQTSMAVVERDEGTMDAEARAERKAARQDRKYSLRYKPKQVGRSVFTIQQLQAKRAERIRSGKETTKPSRSSVFSCATASAIG
jgi:hypothetical protein